MVEKPEYFSLRQNTLACTTRRWRARPRPSARRKTTILSASSPLNVRSSDLHSDLRPHVGSGGISESGESIQRVNHYTQPSHARRKKRLRAPCEMPPGRCRCVVNERLSKSSAVSHVFSTCGVNEPHRDRPARESRTPLQELIEGSGAGARRHDSEMIGFVIVRIVDP